MRLIDADTAQQGLTIVTDSQSSGRGQRANIWQDNPGDSLLMTLIATPNCSLDQQAVFNCGIALNVADVLMSLHEQLQVAIKWPNDIIINDKKAGGILIENVIRGSSWTYSVIGIGINLLQVFFSKDLPYATSLKIESGKNFMAKQVFRLIRERLFAFLSEPLDEQYILSKYNDCLYRRHQDQAFTDDKQEWSVMIDSVARDGRLKVVGADGNESLYNHGEVKWKWR